VPSKGEEMFKERRRAKRVDANLAITITGGPEEAQGKTLNISTNGVLFESPRFIDVLTKVQFELIIPPAASATGAKEERVEIDGVVVRVQPESEDSSVESYRIAVFFTFVSKSSQDVLARFIKSRSNQ
jgi:hypothetical protein